MSSLEQSCDVLVIGAGPAGATAARLLARQGLAVLLAWRAERPAAHAEETLVPTAAARLARLELLGACEQRGWLGSARHGAIWCEPRLAWRPGGASDRGFQVPRADFDALLVERAVESGAELLEIEHVAPILDPSRIELRARSGAFVVRPRLCLVASGRQASDALLPDSSFEEPLPPSIALSTRVPAAGEYQDATVVEAVACGWWWWLAERSGSGGLLTLFVDREELKQRGAAELWRAARESALGPARAAGPAPEAGAQAWCRSRSCSLPLLLCGDAASALDPLSSQGIEKALASGEHAAACARSSLAGEFAPERILEHQRRWERGLFLAHRRSTLEFYSREIRFEGTAFWSARRGAHAARPVLPQALVRSPRATRGQGLVEREGRLCERAVWICGNFARPSSPALDLLLEHAARGLPLVELERYVAHEAVFAGWTPRSLRAALEELYGEGWLVAAP